MLSSLIVFIADNLLGMQVRSQARYDTRLPQFSLSFHMAYLSLVSFADISKSPVSKVPMELAKHESAQHKVSREMKRKRDAEDLG